MLLASVAIPVAFVTARLYFRDQRAALGVAVIVASMPQLAINAFRAGNEGFSIALGSLAVLAVVSLWDSPPSPARGVVVGLSIGAALLTKTYFLALLPWAAAAPSVASSATVAADRVAPMFLAFLFHFTMWCASFSARSPTPRG